MNLTHRLTVLFLLLFGLVRMADLSYILHCANDYVSTINCTLQSNLSMDLFPEKLILRESDMESEPILCPMNWQKDHFFCTVEMPFGFVDTAVYSICLSYHNESCKQLDDEFIPSETIKPKPPCNFTMSLNSSQYIFSWKSNYEEYSDTALDQEFKYQLLFYQKGQEFNGSPHNVVRNRKTFAVPDDVLLPDSEYAAKVRSGPNQNHYKGQWSDWSTEIYWRTAEENKPPTLHLETVLILVCMLVPFFLILCFIPVNMWRLKTFIPTPESYFHTLYTDCQGDFKSWVVMEKTVELPKTEKTVHIDKMFKYEDICEADLSVTQSAYANMSKSEGTLVEPGLPYAVSTSGLDSATASCTNAYLSPQSRSRAEMDSGCWLSSAHSLERGPSWYCNDYCTLSTFHQSAQGTSEPLKCMISGFDETEEIDILC